MNDVTKDLLEALKAAEDYIWGVTAWTKEQEDALSDSMSSAIARAEAALAEPQPDAGPAMTRDDVIRMAREAGIPIERAQFPQGDDMVGSHGLSLLARLVEQARGEEREACAAIIQDAATAAANNNDLRGYELLSALGRAVRARGQK